MKTALITGATGQDGWYLAELLKEKGYSVTGVGREDGDIADRAYVEKLVSGGYEEIYNLAGVATVASPWEDPVLVANVVGMAPVYFLEAIRKTSPQTKFFQASSAEMFGNPVESPQNESTPFKPVTPYGAAKTYAHMFVEEYRAQGVFAVSGILFNHESPRRPESFVTRKITTTLARIAKGSDEVLSLGNLDAERDWSFAGDIVRGAWLSLQVEKSDSYVFASGEVHTVREFVEVAAREFDISIAWRGKGEAEVGVDASGKTVIAVNPAFYRPLDVKTRRGDFTKARERLHWEPETNFNELVRLMTNAEKNA